MGSGVDDTVNGALAEQFHTLQSTVVDEGATGVLVEIVLFLRSFPPKE